MPACIVIDKPRKTSVAVQALHAKGGPFESDWHHGLRGIAPIGRDGKPRTVGPADRMGCSLGPVRVYGYRDGAPKPLMHTKMLVLGQVYEADEMYTGGCFCPDLVWIGSANWTNEAARLRMEAAAAVADRSFADAATRNMIDIIRDSEPFELYSATPINDLAPCDLDMAAFAEYAAMFGVEGDR